MKRFLLSLLLPTLLAAVAAAPQADAAAALYAAEVDRRL